MAIINVAQIEPGMILASEVRDMNGRLLCGAGVEINEKHISIFRAWGVTEADIKGIEEEDVITMSKGEFSPDLIREAEAELNEIFRYTDFSYPVIKELFHLCVLRKAGHE